MAFFKGSAYEKVRLFEADESGVSVFRGLRARRIRKSDPVLEHTISLKERLDSLSQEYYSESRDWRWLVEANPDVLFPEDLLWKSKEDVDESDPGAVDENQTGKERAGEVIIVPRREEIT